MYEEYFLSFLLLVSRVHVRFLARNFLTKIFYRSKSKFILNFYIICFYYNFIIVLSFKPIFLEARTILLRFLLLVFFILVKFFSYGLLLSKIILSWQVYLYLISIFKFNRFFHFNLYF